MKLLPVRLLLGFVGASLLWGNAVSADDAETFFESKIRPVLVESCFQCHGGERVESGLRVDSREALLQGGAYGPALVPGKADESLLVQAIRRTHDDLKMPPKSPLPNAVADDFARWVADGAAWPAFQPRVRRRAAIKPTVSVKKPDDAALKSALQIWLRADGRPWQDGQAVHLWEDESGRGHDLAATAGARAGGTGRPPQFVAESSISGFPAVRFQADSGLGGNAANAPDISGDAEFTMFLVTRLRGVQPSAEGLLAGFGEPAHPSNPGQARSAIIGVLPEGTGRLSLIGGWGNNAVAAPGAQLLDGPPLILAFIKTRGPLAATTGCFVNGADAGALEGQAAVPDFGKRGDLGFMMGHVQQWAQGFAGDVAEVLLYNRALTAEELRGVESHLSAKFRIPLVERLAEETVLSGDPAFEPEHWAFQPLASPPLTAAGVAARTIDDFIERKWREHALHPVAAADAQTLVRRLYFDLHGLPPTPSEMEAAVGALTPWSDDAWSQLIDRLLASPRYGERWGRHWLDVARYADTAGDNADYPVPEARLYRDYVIDAFNSDKPYDEFVREQLAGDLLAAEGPRARYAERVVATGFLAQSRRYATGPYELWHLTLEDTIDTVGQAFMGLQLKCARCHDHKFDPVTQREYYALYGIFDSTQLPWPGAEEYASKKLPRQNFVPLLPAAEVVGLQHAHDQAAASVPAQLARLEKEDPLAIALHDIASKLETLKASSLAAAEIDALQRERDATQQQLDAKKVVLRAPFEDAARIGYPASIPSAYAAREAQPRHAAIHLSGDPQQPGAVVPRGVPSFLPQVELPEIPEHESGRRQLAEWLTRPDHPLTARVMANRVWHHHFGRGLVATPSGFGTRGAPPSNRELLDFLAREFVAGGWSVKALHRLILTSRAWRLSSAHDEANATRDPANDYLWRHDRRRLDAEAIRDALLSVSGRLSLAQPGPHPFSPIPGWGYTQHNQFGDIYPSNHRSVYLMTPRLQRHPFLALFDGPDTNTTTGSRTSAVVPAQALYLMNSNEIRIEAEAFAARLLAVAPEARIATAYALAFQRPPAADESSRAGDFLNAYTQRSTESQAWTALCRVLLTSHDFFYVD